MLDIDKIRWMMNRRDSRWWEEDSWVIYTKLRMICMIQCPF